MSRNAEADIAALADLVRARAGAHQIGQRGDIGLSVP